MLKKTAIALATAVTIGTAALAPSEAGATSFHAGYYGNGFGIHFNAPIRTGYYGSYYAPRYVKRCRFKWRKVWGHYGWHKVRVRRCRWVRAY